MEEKVTVSKKVWISLLSTMLTLATFSACWWLHKMFFSYFSLYILLYKEAYR